MAENLVIVESPAKARTIKKYLGSGFEVLASYGHVRDLIPKEGAVDTDANFAMNYQIIERNEKHVEAIARALKKADHLFLATDPDREGEAIAWHLHELLKERGALKGKTSRRVVFHEITKNAIREAVANPRDLSLDLVNAQQARRALDYLVGFNLSPLLWKKVQAGLSAGRVQSPALRMICEREDEIARFVPQEYWTIDAEGEHTAQQFPLKLVEYAGKKVEQFSFVNEGSARAVESTLRAAAAGSLKVIEIDRKQRRRNPAPPFTTSTLQQEASRKLGFSAQRTMRVAQQLYEGVDIGEGSVGLITYMRTDSVSLAAEAVTEIRGAIERLYGREGLAEEIRVYKTKSKNAQEAHEAVRPTAASVVPADIEKYLESDQFKLYSLIWKRAMACQMAHAVFDTMAIDMLAGPDGPARHLLRANGSTLVKPGYIAVYQEGRDDAADDDSDHVLPPMKEGDAVKLTALHGEQHFTEPPPRYTEASLVKALEEHGIGRPSTYASIISTLVSRKYAEIESRRFTATDIGKIVCRFLTDHFHRYVEYGFTAAMEDELDAVSRGEEPWTTPLEKFWKPFITQVEKIEKNVTREMVAQARELGKDPESGKPVTVRMGRFGPFVQIGTKDDVDKPRFAGLRPGQKMDSIRFDEAMYLFTLPRALGQTADGEKITVAIGRFGPYVKYGSKFVSLKDDDPYTVSLERALEAIAAKQVADANRLIHDFGVDDIQLLNGRYGAYITDRKKNARIPKGREPKSLTLEECRALLAAAPEKGTRGRFGRKFAPASKGKATAAANTTAAANATATAEPAPAAAAPKALKASKAPKQPEATAMGIAKAKSSRPQAAPAKLMAAPARPVAAPARLAAPARPAAAKSVPAKPRATGKAAAAAKHSAAKTQPAARTGRPAKAAGI
jgi:DNA topoisomerase-1